MEIAGRTILTETCVGFDSAWTDNPKARGAICALVIEDGVPHFHAPRLAGFDEALAFIAGVRSQAGATLVALDQSTIVPNRSGMRPVERAAACLMSWLGGGVQPSHRGRLGMFCDASPIWSFLQALGAVDDPVRARHATTGIFLMEVFPAMALASLDAGFYGRRCAPRYNPGRRKTFRLEDWRRVACTAARDAEAFGSEAMAGWCWDAASITQPRKADQDRLDAVLCALIALRWRLRPQEQSLLLGDLATGYMVTPASPEVRAWLAVAAGRLGVPVDGVLVGGTAGSETTSSGRGLVKGASSATILASVRPRSISGKMER